MSSYQYPGGPYPQQPVPPRQPPSGPPLPPPQSGGSDNKIWFITCGAIGCFFFLMIVVIISAFVLYMSASKPEGPLADVTDKDGQGKSCSTDSDCVYPLYCILGSCRQLGNAGDTCGVDTDCNAPLYCIGGTCSAGAGAAGGSGGASSVKGSACSTDADCLPPLYCILFKCNPLGNLGEGCTYDYDCQYPYVCDGGKCASKPSGGGGAGGSATPGTPCGTDADCMPPLFCILKTCRYLGKAGDSCAMSADCTMPLVCEKAKCVDPSGGSAGSGAGTQAAIEVECKKDADCQKKGAGFKFCIANQCRKKLAAAGETCQYTTDCQEGLFCIVAVCRQEQSDQGEPCRSNDDCKRPNLCVNFVCSEQ
jgi:hypothetical protein